MAWSLLPNALQPFKIYCASPSITSQLVLFLQQTVEINLLGHVKVETLQNFVQKWDPVTLSEILLLIARVQQFDCRWDTFCIKDLCPFQFYVNGNIGLDVLWAVTIDSFYLLMLSSLLALLSWGPSMRALACLQSLLYFQYSMCFLSIQSPIAHFGSGPVNGVYTPFLASSSAPSLPKMPSCPGTHTS